MRQLITFDKIKRIVGHPLSEGNNFAYWMNRPVNRVQVYTAQQAQYIPCGAKLVMFRPLRQYRNSLTTQWRNETAARVRAQRAAKTLPTLPVYVEATAEWDYKFVYET